MSRPPNQPDHQAPGSPSGSDGFSGGSGQEGGSGPPPEGPGSGGTPHGHRYRVQHYDGERIHERLVGEEEMRAIDPHSVDFYMNEAEGRINFSLVDGERHEADGWPGLAGQRILHVLQDRPGIFHDPRMIAEAIRMSSLGFNGGLAPHIMRLRALLREKGGPHRYIQSRRMPRYGVRWPREHTWIRIELIISNGAAPDQPGPQ